MGIKELLGFLECEKVERFQKVDSSVESGLLKKLRLRLALPRLALSQELLKNLAPTRFCPKTKDSKE